MNPPGGAAAAAEPADDGGTLVRVTGEIDAFTGATLDNALRLADGTHVVVDLSRVAFMDSAGLQVLLRHHRRLACDGRTLAVRRPSAPVRRLLEVGGGDELTVDP